jgi:hypothetical protein
MDAAMGDGTAAFSALSSEDEFLPAVADVVARDTSSEGEVSGEGEDEHSSIDD